MESFIPLSQINGSYWPFGDEGFSFFCCNVIAFEVSCFVFSCYHLTCFKVLLGYSLISNSSVKDSSFRSLSDTNLIYLVLPAICRNCSCSFRELIQMCLDLLQCLFVKTVLTFLLLCNYVFMLMK